MPKKDLDLDRFSIAVLKLLASDPLKSLYQREVARKAGVSVGKTNQILRSLEREEIVMKERVGRVDLYRFNLQSPLARHLKVLFVLHETGGLVKSLRSITDRVVLFGSSAEGSDTNESDIDLLVVSNEKEGAQRAISHVARSMGRMVSPVILSTMEFSGLKKRDPAFYEQMSRGITLWQKEE